MTKNISQFELTKYILENVNSDNSGLDMKEYIILVSLSSHLNSTTNQCNPSKATLANRNCMSERTVDEAVKGLVEKKFITYDKGGLRGKLREPNSYKLLYDKIYSCVKTEWVEAVPKENLIPAPPEKFRKQYYGEWYNSEKDYLIAKAKREAEQAAIENDDCPF